ncbi:TonB-dependent siderophore receptor [Methylomonas methanica]|uniref:TonB-dependent siderophore receptor n=1 Tax=Methylomonas methanica (strain DSM 25384 / MC09) TaxID=857087 RepID=G0A126_METMM|nr:TonB-dependent receptor [Methylomonas methanica]AEG01282.1 TonB-dependent siderophore receptor [Methylomonas methanica MC09]
MSRAKYCRPLFAQSTVAVLALAFAQVAHGETVAVKQHFNIPAQPLNQALLIFGRQSGLQIMYGTEVADNLRSHALQGDFTPTEALNILLNGTPLRAISDGEGVISLQRKPGAANDKADPSTMPAVKVVGQAVYDSTDPYNPDYSLPNASTATKTDTPIMETPYSIQVVPKQVLEDIQAVRSTDALDYVSGIFRSSGSDDYLDFSTRRGFNNFPVGDYRDGTPLPLGDFIVGGRDMANTERVEALKGPASLLYGMAVPGGIVNFVTKKPLATPYYSLQQQFGSYDFYRTTLDATGPVNDDKTLLYRFNLAYKSANSFRDMVNSERVFVAPTVTWNISPKTQVNFELEYDTGHVVFDRGIPAVFLGTRPADLPRNRYLGEANPPTEYESLLLGVNWSHSFNENWTFSHRFNALFAGVDQIAAFQTMVNPSTINRFVAHSRTELQDQALFFNSINLTGYFDTWGLKHTLLLGGDYYRKHLDNFRASFTGSNTSIYDPVYLGPSLAQAPYTLKLDSQNDWFGLYLQDQIKLPFNLSMLAGFRYDSAESSTTLNNGTPNKNPRQDSLTPRGGVVWQPIPELSLYGSYSENFTGINTTGFGGSVLPPETAQQWEFGAKTELFDQRFLATVAWYDLTKQNVSVFNGITSFNEAIGEAHSAGLEVDAKGEILPGWNMIASYAYTPEALVTQGQADQINQRLRGVPRHGGSLFTSYEFQTGALQGFKLGGGTVIRSSQHTDPTAATAILPGFATVNLLASYSWKVGGSKLTTQLNINNLLDKTYYPASFGRDSIELGAPRTFMGSVRLEY